MRKLNTHNRFAIRHQTQVDKVVSLQPDSVQSSHKVYAVHAQCFVEDFHFEFLDGRRVRNTDGGRLRDLVNAYTIRITLFSNTVTIGVRNC